MSIIINLFEVITGNLRESQGDRPFVVKKVILQVGKLTAVVPEILEYSFAIARNDATFGTLFCGAELEIKPIPLTIRCHGCGKESVLDAPEFRCPLCESQDLSITAGKELFIESVEIDE
jgi:hydrogenase nickel incorporation protein HypA/HybF